MLNAPEYRSTEIRINSCIPAVSFEAQLQLEGLNECLVQAGCAIFSVIMPCVGIIVIHHGPGYFLIKHYSASLHKSVAISDPINIFKTEDLTCLCSELKCKEKYLLLFTLKTQARTTAKAGAFISELTSKKEGAHETQGQPTWQKTLQEML